MSTDDKSKVLQMSSPLSSAFVKKIISQFIGVVSGVRAICSLRSDGFKRSGIRKSICAKQHFGRKLGQTCRFHPSAVEECTL
mmetsp:Transcript_2650/g.7036  ORF Transcript_2650/g.7036 Transcript_2650/m.7036 type:complete len:82 (-) Transcript_2650:543-788(-)